MRASDIGDKSPLGPHSYSYSFGGGRPGFGVLQRHDVFGGVHRSNKRAELLCQRTCPLSIGVHIVQIGRMGFVSSERHSNPRVAHRVGSHRAEPVADSVQRAVRHTSAVSNALKGLTNRCVLDCPLRVLGRAEHEWAARQRPCR